ncbi:DUF4153 domain-containing protein (plasmid) [Pedobacter sp. BS3]|uniref:DUF4153 domain-containing protein n=1 Tax=Pedobacter sp. BS3 TaxID=2567937 RepID=UPI0011EDD079|nr:DUF4153 domain-containing protein [Pedobacter sp. BS3]TZF85865.1 DUF4153 domain-containing protein [Pedobacter sp. BS3]
MKFPSVHELAKSARQVISRFPFELFFALAGTIAATALVELDNYISAANWCIRIIMTANLGLALTFAAGLYAESKGYSIRQKNLLKFTVAFAALGFILILNPQKRETDYLQFILLCLSAHLLVSFSGYLKKDTITGFWQFNKTIFLRFLAGVLYSTVLFAGLSAAIGSMNFLFGFDFRSDTFSILWCWIVGIFQTTFFLAGVPRDITALQQDTSYPKSLKIFTQYVLVPLASVYVLILLAYETKILLEWKLPAGLVSNLILGYAVFGILSLLLVYPIRNREENKWIKTYSRSFYFLLVPLLILLFLAVGVRVKNYGITEERYFLLALAVWLGIITVYFLVSSRQNIKIIPISLCIVSVLSAFGPQGAFYVSKQSQLNRLTRFVENKKAKNRRKEIKNIAYYLNAHHGLKSLQPLVKVDIDSIERHFNAKVNKEKTKWGYTYTTYDAKNDSRDSVLALLEPTLLKEEKSVGELVYFSNDNTGKITLNQPGLMMTFNSNIYAENGGKTESRFKGKGVSLAVDTSKKSYNLVVSINDAKLVYEPSQKLKKLFADKQLIKNSKNNQVSVPLNQMQDTLKLSNQQIIIRFEQLNGYDTEQPVNFYSGYVIVN